MIDVVSVFDTRVLEYLYAIRDPGVVQVLIWVSELGAPWMVAGLTACLTLLLIFYRRYAYALGLAISVATTGLTILLVKGLIERARPPLSFQAYPEIWYSFPSAHAALAGALYGFLAYMAWRMVPSLWGKFLAISAGLLVAGIAFSRIYFGVHYLSDVVAGLLLGVLCAWLGSRLVAFALKV